MVKSEPAWAEEELPCGHAKHPPIAFGFGHDCFSRAAERRGEVEPELCAVGREP